MRRTSRIPRFYAERLPPGETSLVSPSPRAMATIPETWGVVGRQIQETARYAAEVFGKIAEENVRLSVLDDAEKSKNIIGRMSKGIGEKFNNRTDWPTYDSEKEIEEGLSQIRKQLDIEGIGRPYSFKGGEIYSKKINIANEKVLNKVAEDLRNISTVKRNEFLKNSLEINFIENYDNAVENFAIDPDPKIYDQLKLEALTVGTPRAMALMDKWNEIVELKKAEIAGTEIYDNPGLVDQIIKKYNVSEKYKNGIKETARLRTAEIDKKKKEDDKLKHDEVEKEIGNLFLKSEYTKAYNLALASNYLSGDEKKTWGNSINEAIKKAEEDINPNIEDSNYAFVNELISKEVDPIAIRKYIFSLEFKSERRRTLIDRLNTNMDKTINKATSRAYEFMKSQIMPYGGMLAEVPPLQATQYTKSMNALDDWIDKQRKADKSITPKDIQTKAEELAITFQTSISERQEIKTKEDEEYYKGLIKGKEKKTEPTKTEVKPAKKYEATATNPKTGEKMGFINGKWELIPK